MSRRGAQIERPPDAPLYELIGRAVVRFVWWRYKRPIQAAGAAAVVATALGIGAYIGLRDNGEEPY